MARHTLPQRAGLVALALGLVAPAVSAQVAPPPPSLDTGLAAHAAARARARAAQLTPATAPQPDARAAAQHREALGDMERGEWADAVTSLTAALSRARNNPLYRGDLAYAYARLGELDQAHQNYLLAYQGMNQNGWYLVGVAAVRSARAGVLARNAAALREGTPERQAADSVAHGELVEAAGTLQYAMQNDSTVRGGAIAVAAASMYLRAGYRGQALAFVREATAHAPDFAEGWLMIAETDSVAGLEAARRYHALRPGDPRGQIWMAIHLINTGRTDSAMVFAEAATADSSFRPAAAEVFAVAAVARLRSGDIDLALDLLRRGRAWAGPQQLPTFDFYTGWGLLRKMPSLLADAEEQRSCSLAQRADSLAGEAERHLREGASVDSARATQFLTMVIPQYHRNAENFTRDFCRPQPQRRPAQQPPPRRRP
jgi:Tfp pilus assembly protein PilF